MNVEFELMRTHEKFEVDTADLLFSDGTLSLPPSSIPDVLKRVSYACDGAEHSVVSMELPSLRSTLSYVNFRVDSPTGTLVFPARLSTDALARLRMDAALQPTLY